jgi:hypothetical protein
LDVNISIAGPRTSLKLYSSESLDHLLSSYIPYRGGAGATVPLLFAIEWKKYKSKYWKNEISLSFDEFCNFFDMNEVTNDVWASPSHNFEISMKGCVQKWRDIIINTVIKFFMTFLDKNYWKWFFYVTNLLFCKFWTLPFCKNAVFYINSRFTIIRNNVRQKNFFFSFFIICGQFLET